MHRHLWFPLALALGLTMTLAPKGHAESPEVATQYELGKAALDSSDPEAALGHFKAALAQADLSLGSTWQMLLAVALTYQELKNPAYSAEMYRRFLDVTETHSDLMTEKWRKRREVVRKQLTLLEQELATSHAVVMVKSTPSGAAVSVNGERAGVDGDAVTPTRLWLPPGEHTISLELEGHAPATTTIKTRPGQLDSYAPELLAASSERPEGAASAPESAPIIEAPKEDEGGTIGPWVLIGGAGAAAIVGGVMVGLAEGEVARRDEIIAAGDPGEALGPAARDDYNGAEANIATYDTLSLAMFGVAGAAAIGGVLWLLLDGDESTEASASFGLTPAPHGVHAHALWRF